MRSAGVGDTAILFLYGPEWPDQPMRVILNDGACAALGWESEAVTEAEGQIIGSTIRNGRTMPFPRYGVILPTRDSKSDIEQSGLAAGRGVGNIDVILSVGETVRIRPCPTGAREPRQRDARQIADSISVCGKSSPTKSNGQPRSLATS